jgi:hypothetical protein
MLQQLTNDAELENNFTFLGQGIQTRRYAIYFT